MKNQIKSYFSGGYDFFYSKYLPDRKKSGTEEYASQCPFHGDTNPSLNYNNNTGQFFCHGCGEKGDIFHFYAKTKGLDHKNQFSEVMNGIALDFGITIQKPEIVKTYDYKDINGKLIFQVCRLSPKGFRQRAPDGYGGWVWSLKGVNPTIYNLPAVGLSQEVLIVEGEKDCDNLKELGFTATTCPMGAGKWRDDYSYLFEGKDVVLIPDNDPPGMAHMENIGEALGGLSSIITRPRSIKTLILPNLPEKGDVSDWISQNDNPGEKLRNLIDGLCQNPEPKPEPLKDKDKDKNNNSVAIFETKAEELIKKFDDDPEQALFFLIAWNQSQKECSVPEKEVKKIFESVKKSYGHKKIKEDSGAELFKKIEKLKYPDGNVKYQVYVDGFKDYIVMDAEDFTSKVRFKTKFFKTTDISPKLPKGDKWDEWLTKIMKSAIHIDVPADETPIGSIRSIIIDGCNQSRATDDMGMINKRIIYKDGYSYFTVDHIRSVLQFSGNIKTSAQEIGSLLRRIGCEKINIENGSVRARAWKIKTEIVKNL